MLFQINKNFYKPTNILESISGLYGGIFRTYIVLLFISCARLFYFVDRFFFSIISCARLFYFVDRFFFSIILCARLFFTLCVVFSFLLSRAHDFFSHVVFSFLLFRANHLLIYFLVKSYIHTRQPTNPRQMPTIFYCLVGYDWVKKITRSY